MTSIADIYVRLSEQDRDKKSITDESESIQNQKTMLINYCLEKGWIINGIYCDEDYSGADSSRPAWNQLLNDCQSGKCNVVVCKTQSRFSRDMEMIERYLHGKFTEWGVRFVGVVDNADTNIKGNKKARQINGLINEWYLEDLSENIRSTLSAKRKSGQFVGSFAPYGYLVDPYDKNRLVIDNVAAEIVRRIFNMYLSGFGYVNIAKALNDDKIPPPCIRKKQLSSRYYNANFERSTAPTPLWTASAIYTILRREEYTGRLIQGRGETVNYKTGKRCKKTPAEWDVTENAHQPIITNEQFLAVEKMRQARSRGQKIPSGECHPLAQKVFCGECGNTMWKMSYNLSGGRYNYLACKSRKLSANACQNSSIRLDVLENIVLSEINDLISEHYDKKLIGNVTPQITKTQLDKKELYELEKAVLRYEKQIDQMYKDRLDELITAEQYKKFSKELIRQCDIAKQRIDRIKATAPEKVETVFNQATRIDKLTFFIAQCFIESVYIGEQIDGQREIKINWLF